MRRHLGAWLNILLVLVIAGAIGWLSTQYGFVADWTRGARASLAPATKELLQQLPGKLTVTSYASPGSGLRPTVAAFIARYQRVKPDLELQFVDPETDPAAMREAGIQVDGEMVVAWHGQSEHLTTLSTSVFANTLARLARGNEHLVAFVTGAGERNAAGKANADLGQFMASLESRGLRAVPLNFAQVGAVPQGANLVVLASPLVDVSPGAVDALVGWIKAGGNLLWLTEPDPRDLNLTPLADALGIRIMPGMLVDGAGAKLGLSDPRNVVVGSYPDDQAVTAGLKLVTLFPQVAPLAVITDSGWSSQALLTSSAQSWNERQPIDPRNPSTIQFDADADELRGPLDFGFALTRPAPGTNKAEQRVVVLGDGDFLSNSFVSNGGNAVLGRRIFNWLLGDDNLVSLPARPAPDRHVALGQTGLGILAGGLLIGLPLLILIITGVLFWRRRRR